MKKFILLPVCMLLLAACGGNNPSASAGGSTSGGASVTPSTSEEPAPDIGDYDTIEEVIGMTKGAACTTAGVYMGHNDKEVTFSGVKQWNAVFLADGDKYLQVYQTAQSVFTDMDKWEIGVTIVKVEGTVAHYQKAAGDIVTYEIKGTDAYEVSDPSSKIADPIVGELDATHPTLTMTQDNVSMPVAITDGIITVASANSYGNLTITFTAVASGTAYTLYLDSRYTDVSTITTVAVVGAKFSTTTFVGAVGTSFQFIYALNFTVAD